MKNMSLWFWNVAFMPGDACRDSVVIHFTELLPALIGRLKDLLTFIVMFVQLFLFLWQSLSLMDVDEDTSGYLEFIGEFRSLSNVIAIIIVLSRMRLLAPQFVFYTLLVFMCFLPNIREVFDCAFVFLEFIYNMEWNFTLPAHS
jgi:hypothetical protein